MRVIRKVTHLKDYRNDFRNLKLSIGLVPTMGYLHEGHLSLIHKAKQQTDSVWVSIFVNPAQFSPNEDLEKYPRDEKMDLELCRKEGVDVVFLPSADEMYPEGFNTYVEVKELTEALCGASRPTHFRGVTTVVSKLFNIVQPQKAYFGQKDAQQAIVLDRMTKDLNFPLGIVVCPIVREPDGLALSSRNVYLTSEQRQQALALSASLKKAEELFDKGEREPAKILKVVKGTIEEKPDAKIDYISIVRTMDLKQPEELVGGELLALAVFFGSTRLIDNTILGDGTLLQE